MDDRLRFSGTNLLPEIGETVDLDGAASALDDLRSRPFTSVKVDCE